MMVKCTKCGNTTKFEITVEKTTSINIDMVKGKIRRLDEMAESESLVEVECACGGGVEFDGEFEIAAREGR